MSILPCHDEEHERGHLLEHLVQPLVLERHRDLEQVNDDASEVDVAHHHDVEVPEQLELLQGDGGLAVGLRGLLQVLDGPDHGQEDGAAAQQVDQDEDVLPPEIKTVAQLKDRLHLEVKKSLRLKRGWSIDFYFIRIYSRTSQNEVQD